MFFIFLSRPETLWPRLAPYVLLSLLIRAGKSSDLRLYQMRAERLRFCFPHRGGKEGANETSEECRNNIDIRDGDAVEPVTENRCAQPGSYPAHDPLPEQPVGSLKDPVTNDIMHDQGRNQTNGKQSNERSKTHLKHFDPPFRTRTGETAGC